MTELRTIWRKGRAVIVEHDPRRRGVDRAAALARAKAAWQVDFYANCPPDRVSRQVERAIMRREAKR